MITLNTYCIQQKNPARTRVKNELYNIEQSFIESWRSRRTEDARILYLYFPASQGAVTLTGIFWYCLRVYKHTDNI